MTPNTESTRIFVVEDDPIYQRMIKYLMELNPDHEVHVFATGQECLQHLDKKPNIISLDYSLPDMTGEEVLRKIKAADQDIGVIILSGQQDISTAVQLLKNGAFDYITKDNETKDRLLNAIGHIKNQNDLQEEVSKLRDELEIKYEFGNSVIGNSNVMQPVFKMMGKAAQSNITISLYGATGTGKEVVAKSIHFNSSRQKGPFIPVNMGAIPRELVESELFGHEKGAFTGAMARKKGHFELANGGTLFLDEVAEMEASTQTKLLRALQEREVVRVGGEKAIPFDARIIIATHKDLAEEARKGRFREDLYYRLLGLNIKLPPLWERGNDILLLAQSFLDKFTQQNKMPQQSIAKGAKSKLLAYSYPGNVRELKAIMDLAAVLSNGKIIQEEDIQFNSVKREAGFLTQELTLEGYKNLIIKSFLEKYDDDVMLVAQKLDIGKSTIYRMIKEEKS